MPRHFIILYFLLVIQYSPPATGQPSFRFTSQSTPTTASLRGLSVVSDRVVWASGSEGTVLRTTDGGVTWQLCPIPGTDSLDFRSLHAFSADEAFVLSAGEPALLYHTTDGGTTWQLRYQNHTPGIFFDALTFWDATQGIAMSDPVDGRFVLIATHDGGQTWRPLPTDNMPAPVKGEAGFAASNGGLATGTERNVWFATGGAKARVFHSQDRGQHWQVANTPMQQGEASQGIFALVMIDSRRGVAVGGDYLQPADTTRTAGYTTDGGRTWQLPETFPNGYRSAVAYHPATEVILTVGPSGSDYSTDYGRTWQPVDTVGYHTVRFAPNEQGGWAAGSNGHITQIRW
jgi:photosystem II stability/assembly factor-like uncharacterized protein